MITQKIKLNLIPGRIRPRIKASQYDTGARTLVFKLYNGVQEFPIPTDSTVSIRGTKSDRTGFQYECEYSGNEVTTKITDQMTVSPGEVLAELVITNDGNRIATENFIFENEEAALKEDVPISHTDIPWIERIDDIVDLVEEDAKRAETASDRAEDALGQIGDSVERSETAANQASASATNAASSAAQASNSATAASTSELNALASERAAKTSEDNASASAAQAATSASNAADSASDSADSAANALASERAAKTSEDNASASKNVAAQSALDASGSASAASASATQAATSATNAATSEGNAAISAANAATSETNASQSATAASGSATDASESASDADTSATNAENSATLARKWAVGDSGSGSNVPSDTNNAYYWAQVAASAASGGLHFEFVDELPVSGIDTRAIYLVPSDSPEEKNTKDEYLNKDGTVSGWEKIGSTKIDISGYYTKAQTDTLLQDVKDYADSKVAELKGYVQENYTTTALLKDTVGWTGKNLLKNTATTRTINGVTFTVNADKSVTVNGTATAQSNLYLNDYSDHLRLYDNAPYICSIPDGSVKNSTFWLYIRNESNTSVKDILNDEPFTLNVEDDYRVLIAIAANYTANNLTFYPMLRRADIADDTWEPYHESVEEAVEELQEFDSDYANVYGAKNLIPYPYDNSGRTDRGITFAVDDNGVISVTGNKTTGDLIQYYLVADISQGKNGYDVNFIKKGMSYKLSGCPAGGSASTYRLRLILNYNKSSEGLTEKHYSDTGNGVVFTPDFDVNYARLMIDCYGDSGTTYGDLTFKPMLRLASIKDDTWQPYAKTNKQLTEDVKRLEAYEFATLEAAQAAVQAGKVPDGAIIYIPGESGGGI